jgi:hypothetical protein
MWALVIAFLSVGGLVKFAYGQKEDPTLKLGLRKSKFIRLTKTPVTRLTLDQAEDGMVLSRQFDAPKLERRFRAVAEKLKAARRASDRTKGSTP